jgi:hypothetical protein
VTARLERKVDYLFQQLGINPDITFGPVTVPEPSSGAELRSSFYDALCRGGNIVEAVNIYCETTGVGLADVKKAVEAIARANS